MLEVKIDLIPFGDERERKTLHKAHIVNNGKGTPTKGDYDIIIWKKGPNKDQITCAQALRGCETSVRRVCRQTKVTSFPRTNKNAWYLLYEALKNVFEED